MAFAGPERARLLEELLVQDPAIRRGALEELCRLDELREADADANAARAAAEIAALAVTHEDEDTARAALHALLLAPAEIAEPAAIQALPHESAGIRLAAAELVSRRPSPGSYDGRLSSALAERLGVEADDDVVGALLLAIARAGGQAAVAKVTEVLAREREVPGSAEAAEALARRFPAAARSSWQTAPARAESRWARALAAARTASVDERPGAVVPRETKAP